MHPFVTSYNQNALPKLKEQGNYASAYQVPKVTKVVVNIGVGDTVSNGKALEEIIDLSTSITGQKPVETKARKAIAGFKIRQNMVVGLKTTLRSDRMNDFMYKLIQVVLPRTRDFRGLPITGVTADGNLNIGIRDTMIFPEVAHLTTGHGIQITIVSNAKTQESARLLYESLGFVFQKEGEEQAPKKKSRTNFRKK